MATELTGTYTYRSFHNRPEPVDDFNQLRFGQLELRLAVEAGDQVTGVLVFPATPGTEPLVMDVSGRTWAGPPEQLTFTGRGRPNTPIADLHYEYDGIVLPRWVAQLSRRAGRSPAGPADEHQAPAAPNARPAGLPHGCFFRASSAVTLADTASAIAAPGPAGRAGRSAPPGWTSGPFGPSTSAGSPPPTRTRWPCAAGRGSGTPRGPACPPWPHPAGPPTTGG